MNFAVHLNTSLGKNKEKTKTFVLSISLEVSMGALEVSKPKPGSTSTTSPPSINKHLSEVCLIRKLLCVQKLIAPFSVYFYCLEYSMKCILFYELMDRPTNESINQPNLLLRADSIPKI